MKIKNNIVYWKSVPEMYQKEILGTKPNTVRILSEQEHIDLLKNIPYEIVITNTETDLRFTRFLSDITYFRSPLIGNVIIGIFSWRP